MAGRQPSLSFLWIVGVAITLSLGRRLAAGVPPFQLFAQAARRAGVLYLLGCAKAAGHAPVVVFA